MKASLLLRRSVLGCGAFLWSGCASFPSEISPSYVSPSKYQEYDREQVLLEITYVTERAVILHRVLEDKAKGDTAQLGIGLFLFFPVLFALEGGDGANAVEYGRLKGELDALHRAAIQLSIPTEELPPSLEELIESV